MLTSWPALDVAIGLAFTFAMLSLICTSLNEGLATIFNWRARTLERWIGTVLSDPSQLDRLVPAVTDILADADLPSDVQAGINERVTSLLTDTTAVVSDIKANLTAELRAAGVDETAALDLVEKLLVARNDSAAPPATVTQADTPAPKVARAAQRASADRFFVHPAVKPLVKQPKWGPAKLPITGARQGRRPSYVPASTFVTYLLHEASAGRRAEVSVQRVIAGLPGAVRTVVDDLGQVAPSGALDAAGGELSAVRARLENWYDESMQRVSGWYKRRTQLWLAIIGLILAAGLNADTIQIADSLWSDTTLRSAIVANAGRAVANPKDIPTSQGVRKDLDKVHELNLPLGWNRPGTGTWKEPQSARLWASKVIGILMTALALMLGAPFWFDLLGRFVQIRASGDEPSRGDKG